jgi:dihydroorotate dehydrogenase (NAD+) catalytic subunit
MALYLVHKVVTNVKIPVIGVGGIMDYQDALEFIIVGASAIQVGTANFINPKTAIEIVQDLTDYCVREKVSNINQIIGSLKTNGENYEKIGDTKN